MSDSLSQTHVNALIAQQIFKQENPPPPVLLVQPSTLSGKEAMKLPSKKKADPPKPSKYTRYALDKESLRDASHSLPYVLKFFLMIYRLSPVRTVVIVSVFLVQGLLPALRLRTGGDFIQQLQDGIQSGTLNSKNLMRLAITQALTYMLEQSAWTLLRNMEDKTQHRLATEMDVALMRAHLRLDVSQMMDEQIKDSFMRAQHTLAVKPIDLLTRQLSLFQTVMSIIAESVTLASMTPRRAWIMIFMSTVSPLAQNLLGKFVYHDVTNDAKEHREYDEQLSRAETMKFYAHSLSMRPELTILGLRDWVVREYQKSSSLVAEMELPADPNNLRDQFLEHIESLASTGSRAIMYLLVALKSDYFGIPLASLTYLEQSSQALFRRTWSLWKRTALMLHDLLSIQELFECMEIQPAMKTPDNPAPYESVSCGSGMGMKIEVKGVSYKYPNKKDFVLKDISFVLEAGETLALLGFNGSGKSTLIKLLTRLFEPTEGEILINNVDIKNYNREELYEKMSVLFQDYRKFVPLRVSENIRAGNIENEDEENIRNAARDGGADQFIEKLPRQYDTKLRDGQHAGPRFPSPALRRPALRRRFFFTGHRRGGEDEEDPTAPVDLSGGQWQRLALSRAFMRASSADLLILDEPSSSLDPEAEHKLFQFIQQVRRNKTTIYVTHRFYTVRMATKIAFLEEGRLIEWGGHDELMKIEGGKYAKLYQLQSEGFSSSAKADEDE